MTKDILKNYKCSKCGAINCKLWRKYQSQPIELICARCAAKMTDLDLNSVDAEGQIFLRSLGLFSDQIIPWYVPAIPVDENTFWSYTSITPEGVQWWKDLPTLSGIEFI